MPQYLLRRTLQGLLTLFLLSILIFALANVIMPGDFVSNFANLLTGEERELWRAELGLDQTLVQQYVSWIRTLASGSLGMSNYGLPVGDLILVPFSQTLFIFVTGTLLAFLMGQWLGKVSAWRGPGLLTDSATFTGIILYAFFPPTLAFLVYTLLVDKLHLLPPGTAIVWRSVSAMAVGFRPYTEQLAAGLMKLPPMFKLIAALFALALVMYFGSRLIRKLTRFRVPSAVLYPVFILGWMGSWYLFGIDPIETVKSFGVAIIVFTLLTFGEIAVLMRTSMVDTLYEDYVNAATAKGLKSKAVRDRHAARNALLPVISKMVVSLPYLMTGLVIVELALGINGMGKMLFEALGVQDFPVVLGGLMSIGVLSLAARLVLEILIVILDPRIRRPVRGHTERKRFPILAAIRDMFEETLNGNNAARHRQAQKERQAVPMVERQKAFWRQMRARLQNGWRNWSHSWGIFRLNPLGMIGLGLIILFALLAIVHPILMNTIWPNNIYNPEIGFDMAYFPHPVAPNSAHLLGTDVLGRDVLSMLMASTKSIFVLAITAAITTAVLSTLIGAFSAYYRGAVDAVLSNISDAMMLIPAPIAMVILGARFYGEMDALLFGLIYGILAGASSAAIVMRSHALSLMARPFIEAARVSGARGPYIVFKHLVPNMAPLAAVQMMTAVTGAVVADGFIAFFGLRATRMNWGVMIYNAFSMLRVNPRIPWTGILAPTLALSLFAAAFYLISRGLHDVADPRLQQR